MKLKKSQVRQVEQDLIRRGVDYPPLREDLLDHVCSEIEIRITRGEKFSDAHEQALALFLPEEFKKVHKQTMKILTSRSLLYSYLQTATRNLVRHGSNTFINVFGLTVSVSICILIFIFIRYELSFDQQHPESNIFRLVTQIRQSSGAMSSTAFTGAPWGPAMVQEFPKLQGSARIMKYRLDVLVSDKASNTSFYEPDLIWGDQQLLEFFQIDFSHGDQSTALTSPNTVVITERIARKYFGEEPAIGRVLTYNNEVDLVVTGVIKEMPDNMHFNADIIGSFSSLNSFWRIINNWRILYYHTYFKVQEQSDVAAIAAKLQDFVSSRVGSEWGSNRSFLLQDVKNIHLNSGISNELRAGTDARYLYVLSSIALTILLLATANFVNLNIARSLRRLHEVGIRKVMGGLRADLMYQFVMESGLLALIALILALLVGHLLLPFFNQLLDKQLSIFSALDAWMVLYLLIILVLVSVFSGIYPALRAYRSGTIAVLKSKSYVSSDKTSIGNALIVFQFAICTTLFIAIGVIKLQQNYIFSKDLGYEDNQVIMFSTNNIAVDDLSLVKNEVQAVPVVSSVSITSHKLVGDQPYYSSYVFSSPRIAPDTLGLGRLHVDEDFVKTYQIELVAGRDYNPAITSDSSSFLINEKVVRALGISNDEALDLTINYLAQGENGRYPRSGKVIGVVKDFHFQSLHEEIDGLVMDIQPARAHFMACKMNQPLSQANISRIASKVEPFVSGIPVEHFYLEDQFGMLYRSESKFDTLITIATGAALTIALLGLFALVSQFMTYKMKEIGIRKVLGANPLGILLVFIRQYIGLMLLSLLVAVPLSYYWMNQWLQDYAYRIDFPVLWTLVAVVLILGVTFSTISFITRKAVMENPIKTLRED